MKRLLTPSLIRSVKHTHRQSCKIHFRDNWENLNMQLLFSCVDTVWILFSCVETQIQYGIVSKKMSCLGLHAETFRGRDMGQLSK